MQSSGPGSRIEAHFVTPDTHSEREEFYVIM
jgi:hypothetical protein